MEHFSSHLFVGIEIFAIFAKIFEYNSKSSAMESADVKSTIKSTIKTNIN